MPEPMHEHRNHFCKSDTQTGTVLGTCLELTPLIPSKMEDVKQKKTRRLADDTPECYKCCPNCGPSPERFTNPLVVGLIFALMGVVLLTIGILFKIADLQNMLGPVCLAIGVGISIATLVFICKAISFARLNPDADLDRVKSTNRVSPSPIPEREDVTSPSNVNIADELFLTRELTVTRPDKGRREVLVEGSTPSVNTAQTLNLSRLNSEEMHRDQDATKMQFIGGRNNVGIPNLVTVTKTRGERPLEEDQTPGQASSREKKDKKISFFHPGVVDTSVLPVDPSSADNGSSTVEPPYREPSFTTDGEYAPAPGVPDITEEPVAAAVYVTSL